MQLNKTYLYVSLGLLAMAGATVALVLKAPNKGGASASKPALDPVGLNKPRALAFAKDGSLIVVDSRNNRLEFRSPAGAVLKHIGRGEEGSGKGEFREPCGVAVDADGNIFVADTFHTVDPNHGLPWGRVEKFDAGGNFVAEVGKSDAGDFFGPRALAVDPQGRVWVSDTGNSRLVVFDNNLKFIKAVGARGDKDLQFQEPFGIAADAEGNMYVADRLNFRVQVVGPAFNLVRQFKVDGWEANQINMEPYLAVDSKRGLVWITDPTKNRVLRYNLKGQAKKAFDKAALGAASVAFDLPTGIALAADGTAFISDSGSGRILTLKP
jgi:DNA-binding beta-propeller fold protein YncE